MGLSLDQISARIQVVTSQSFRKRLHTCRLKNSMQLLETTEIEITHIASRTGFATVQYFSRVFSNIVGVSPRKYRQRRTTRLPVLRSLSQIASSLELPFKFFKSPLQHR